MFVQMVQHKQRPFVAEFVNHVPNRTVQVLRIYLLIYFSHKDIYNLPFIGSLGHFAKCAAKLQKISHMCKLYLHKFATCRIFTEKNRQTSIPRISSQRHPCVAHPHISMESIIGISDMPNSEIAYSLRGGSSG